MIVVMKSGVTEKQIQNVIESLEEHGLKAHLSRGEETTIIGCVGDKKKLDDSNLLLFPGVEKLVPITETYKLVNKKMVSSPTIVRVGNLTIGGDELVIMAGPCAIESEKQLFETAYAVKAAGAQILRGGAYKPRTSPYSFQGLEEEGLKMMAKQRAETGLYVVCEITSEASCFTASKYVDMLQIGARNMQNFELLKEVGKTDMPVLLKRGLSATIEEWLNAAEYIMSGGNKNVILCERGIRTFETATRNTLDISAVPVLKSKTHLPVIVDPSHGTGIRELVAPMSKAAVCAGADGLMIEVHVNPKEALSDGPQSLNPEDFKTLISELKTLAGYVGKKL